MALFGKKTKIPKDHKERCISELCPCYIEGRGDVQKAMDEMMDAMRQFLLYYDRNPDVEETSTKRNTT